MVLPLALTQPRLAAIARTAHRYEFFALVDLLERLLPSESGPGSDGDAAHERVGFRHSPRLAGALPDVLEVEPTRDREGIVREAVGETTMLGLTGAGSPLLEGGLTELVLHDDELGALAAVLDALGARRLGLLYRIWRTHRSSAGAASPPARGSYGRPSLATRALALSGRDPRAGTEHAAVSAALESAIADLRRGQPATTDADVAERILRLLLPDVPLRLVGATPVSVSIPDDGQATLGDERCVLGVAVCGDQLVDVTLRQRIEAGPLDSEAFEALTPGGRLYPRVRQITQAVFGRGFEVELDLLVSPDHAPCAVLGADRGAVLGVDTRVSVGSDEPLRARVLLTDDPGSATVLFVNDQRRRGDDIERAR